MEISRSTRTHSGSKENIQHQCRVLLEGPPLAAAHVITMHTSRNGSAEQNIFQTKILMWMHSLYGQNILPEVLSPSLPLPRSSSLQAPLSLQNLLGEHGARAESGRNHVACNKSRRTSKGQGRWGCLELETRCMDTWGS